MSGGYDTHFEWSWDDNGGLFKRFQRGSQLEAWLVGVERPDVASRQAGRSIEIAPGISRTGQVMCFGFTFSVAVLETQRERIEELMRFAVADGRRLEYQPLAELWKLCEPKDMA